MTVCSRCRLATRADGVNLSWIDVHSWGLVDSRLHGRHEANREFELVSAARTATLMEGPRDSTNVLFRLCCLFFVHVRQIYVQQRWLHIWLRPSVLPRLLKCVRRQSACH